MNWQSLVHPVLIWFVLGLAMFLMELAGPGLVFFFFGVGAWIVAFLCFLFNISVNAQLALFMVTSVLTLVLFRKWLKGAFYGHVSDRQNIENDLEEFVGHRAVVDEEIVPGQIGKVEFKGTRWDAEADEHLSMGTAVTIIEKDNLTLKVKRLTK